MKKQGDLPTELRLLFGNASIHPDSRETISEAWNKMDPNEQAGFVKRLGREQDLMKRLALAEIEADKKLRPRPS